MQRLKLKCLLLILLLALSGCASQPPVCQLPVVPEWMLTKEQSSIELLNRIISPSDEILK